MSTTTKTNKALEAVGPLLSLQDYRRCVGVTAIMPIDNTPLVYCRAISLLFCRICSKVLSAETNERHLRERHRSQFRALSKRERASIQEDVGGLEVKATVEAIGTIPPNTVYLADLAITFQNFKCRACNFALPSQKGVRIHYNTVHPELIERREGRKTKAGYVLEQVPLQVLEGFTQNKKIYFIPKLPRVEATSIPSRVVERPSAIPEGAGYTVDRGLQASLFEKYIEREKQRQDSSNQADTSTANDRLIGAFARNSGIYIWLKDKDRGALLDLITPPADCLLEVGKKMDLTTFEANVLEVMRTVHQQLEVVPRSLRQLLRQEEYARGSKETRDFRRLEEQSARGYFQQQSRLFSFILRVYAIKRSYTGEALDRTKAIYLESVENIQFSPGVYAAIRDLLRLGIRPIIEDRDYALAFIAATTSLSNALLSDRIGLSTRENQTFTNPTVNFLFISALKPEARGLKEVGRISNIVVMLLYGARLLFVGKFLSKEYNMEPETPEEKAEITELFRREARQLLSNESGNYFEELIQTRNYLLSLGKSYISQKYTIAENPIGVIVYDTIPYPLDDIRRLFTHLSVQLERILVDDLARTELEGLGINFGNVGDTPLLNKVGESIADTLPLKQFKGHFLKQLLKTGSPYNKRFLKRIGPKDRVELKPENTAEFVRKFHYFTELLAVAINLFSGGPLRIPELGLVLYKNTEVKVRSLIYDDGLRMFLVVTDYYKTKNITRRERQSKRYLPPKLSRLLLLFLVFIVPFRDYIFTAYYGEEEFNNPYLFARTSTYISRNGFTNRLKAESSHLFRSGLAVASWRRIINFIIKTRIGINGRPEDSNSEGSDSKGDLIEDRQANRSTRISLQYYLGGDERPGEIRELFQFSRRYFRFFGIEQDTNSNEIQEEQPKFSLPPAGGSTLLQLAERDDLLEDLRNFYSNQKAEFLNKEQRDCVSLVLEDRRFITYINRTGLGKSLVYLLPAFIKRSHLFIVITPRLSLKQDLFQKAEKLRLNPALFENGPTYSSNLVFCSAESLGTRELEGYITKHRDLGRDTTIFLDEAHLFITKQTFRAPLRFLKSILRHSTNIVAITATMPKALLRIYNLTFGIGQFNNIIRGTSNRADITYKREYFRLPDEKLTVVANIVDRITRTERDRRAKILIFVTGKESGRLLSELLKAKFLYSGKEDFDTTLTDFLADNSSPVLITTSVLEVGIDIPQVRYTICVEPWYSLLSLVQSSGRIRNKGISYIVVRQPALSARAKIEREFQPEGTIDDVITFNRIDKQYYARLTIEKSCLRAPISLFLDNRIYRCEPGRDDLCSICEEELGVVRNTRTAEELNSRREKKDVLRLEMALSELKEGSCFYCLLDPYRPDRSVFHPIGECPRAERDRKFQDLKQRIARGLLEQRLPLTGSGCFRCLIPKNLCKRQAESNGLEEDSCFMGTFLKDALAIIFQSDNGIYNSIRGLPKRREELQFWLREITTPTNVCGLQSIRLIDILRGIEVEDFIARVNAFIPEPEPLSEGSKRRDTNSRIGVSGGIDGGFLQGVEQSPRQRGKRRANTVLSEGERRLVEVLREGERRLAEGPR